MTHRRLISGEVFRGDTTLKVANSESSEGSGLAATVCAGVEACETVEVCSIGVPGGPIEFLRKAVDARHPRSLESHLDPLVDKVVDENFHGDPSKLAKKRIEFFCRWHDRANKCCESMLDGAPEYIKKLWRASGLHCGLRCGHNMSILTYILWRTLLKALA